MDNNPTTESPPTATLEECAECYYPVFLRMHGRGCPQGTLRPTPLPDGPPTPCDTIMALLEDYPYYERRHWDTFFGWLKEKHEAEQKAYIKLATWRGYPPPDPKGRYDLHYYDGFPYDYDKLRERLHALSLPDAVALAGMAPVEIEARLGVKPRKAERVDSPPQPAPVEAEGKGKTLADFATDLSTYVDDGKPTPMLLTRSDGKGLLYEGETVWLAADVGVGKTWFQTYIALMQLQMGRRVAFCAWEGAMKTPYRRLKLMGLDPVDYPGQFLYIEPGFENEPDIMGALCDWLIGGENGPASVHIESVTSSGADPNGANLLDWWTKVVAPLTRTGASVILSDHPPKRIEGSAPGPMGSNFKRMEADQIVDFKRGVTFDQNRDGYTILTNVKGRHGDLAVPDGEVLARLVFTNEGGGVHIAFDPPEDEDNITGAEMRAAVMRVLRGLKEHLAGQIEGYAALLALAPGNKNRKAAVVKHMKEEGLLTQSAKGKGKTRYWATEQGHDYLDAYTD